MNRKYLFLLILCVFCVLSTSCMTREEYHTNEKNYELASVMGNYIGSAKSDKYHNSSCRYAKKITETNQIWFDTEEEAIVAGYSPCGVCKP